MNQSKIKIAMVLNDMNINGISSVVMNYCSNLDKTKFDVTIISGKPINSIYKEESKKNGVSLIELPERRDKVVQFYWHLYRVFITNKYNIVHVHGNSAMITPDLLVAKISGIKKRIAHCHNSTCDHISLHEILLPLFKKLYTHGLACSELAGEWLFGNKKYDIIRNGFVVSKFRYNEAIRKQLRQKLDLENRLVIGNVARFNNQKNHPMLLEIFQAINKYTDNARLVLIGDGPDLPNIIEKINQFGLMNKVIYLGESSQVNDLYNLMDIFVLPSKHEGLGIVFIEAQINGLPVITSDEVPREVNINNMTTFIPLSDSPERWAKVILNSGHFDRNKCYEQNRNYIKEYDIDVNVKLLELYYKKVMEEE